MIQSILDALDTDISYLVAMLLVLFYAWSRFNTPRTVRSETSRFQFYGSGVAYVICCEAMLLIITWLVKDNPNAINWLHMGAEGSVGKQVSGFDAPAIGALMLTTLLPSFPFLRDFDAGMLSFFHGMGAIPVNAIRWVQRLGSVSFVMTESALERARQYVRCRPELQDDLALKLVIDPEGARIPHAFTEVVVLYVAYRDLEISTPFRQCVPGNRYGVRSEDGELLRAQSGLFRDDRPVVCAEAPTPRGCDREYPQGNSGERRRCQTDARKGAPLQLQQRSRGRQ